MGAKMKGSPGNQSFVGCTPRAWLSHIQGTKHILNHASPDLFPSPPDLNHTPTTLRNLCIPHQDAPKPAWSPSSSSPGRPLACFVLTSNTID
jgi:hypothetical protein